jgi:predicted DCC family thiol-disulfide oxidoreductase YuxK
MVADARLTVLYDADCAFCTWTVRQLARIDRAARLRLLPLQEASERGSTFATVAATYPLPEVIHVVGPDGSVYAGGDALIEVFGRLPGGGVVRAWSRLPGARALAGAGYRVVARNREALGRAIRATGASCDVPRRA